MHADEAHIDAELVHRLLSQQFPQWADLPLSLVDSHGTDHRIYRLGRRLSVRMPRVATAARQAARDRIWLPKLAPHLPLAIPIQRAMGRPAAGYPFQWSVCDWLPGERAAPGFGDLQTAATDLAGFIAALRAIDATDAPQRRVGDRGGPLAERDGGVRRAVAELGGRIDGAAALRCWEESLQAPVWMGPRTWAHGDLLPGNLVVLGGRLSGVIDFGCLNAGDPACDLLPAWNMFEGPSRARLRSELAVDDASWLRGRG